MTDTARFRVMDFDCPTCATTVQRALERTDGVERVEVHYTTGRIEVEYDPSAADLDEFEAAIESSGYTPQSV